MLKPLFLNFQIQGFLSTTQAHDGAVISFSGLCVARMSLLPSVSCCCDTYLKSSQNAVITPFWHFFADSIYHPVVLHRTHPNVTCPSCLIDNLAPTTTTAGTPWSWRFQSSDSIIRKATIAKPWALSKSVAIYYMYFAHYRWLIYQLSWIWVYAPVHLQLFACHIQSFDK
jgi:hypothetical protein